MAVPKRRHSHARKNKRRSQYKATSYQYTECPKCHGPKLSHRVCPNCGAYKDKIIVPPKEKSEKT